MAECKNYLDSKNIDAVIVDAFEKVSETTTKSDYT